MFFLFSIKRNVTLSNFPLDQIGKNFTSLFNLLWNSNLPCYNKDDRPGSHHLLKRCFLYGKEQKCSEAILYSNYLFLNNFLPSSYSSQSLQTQEFAAPSIRRISFVTLNFQDCWKRNNIQKNKMKIKTKYTQQK